MTQYYESFKSAGYDDLETVQTMSEEELQNYVGIKLPGHRRKLTVEFAKLKTQIQHPPESVLSVNEEKKRPLQTVLTFTAAGLTASLPASGSDLNKDPWDRFLIPSARSEQTKFFNAIIPGVYNAAYRHLGSTFEGYWLKERRLRWSIKQQTDAIQAAVQHVRNMDTERNYIAKLRSVTLTSKPQDVTSCQSAEMEMDKWIKKCNDILKENQSRQSQLFQSNSNNLKLWASEQYNYHKNVAKEIGNFLEELIKIKSDIQTTHAALATRHKFFVKSAESFRKRKRKADNNYKTKVRKQQSDVLRIFDLVTAFCSNDAVLPDSKCDVVYTEPINEGQKHRFKEITVKEAIQKSEADVSVLDSLKLLSHYNALLFLRRKGFFGETMVHLVDDNLDKMSKKISTFKNFQSKDASSSAIEVEEREDNISTSEGTDDDCQDDCPLSISDDSN